MLMVSTIQQADNQVHDQPDNKPRSQRLSPAQRNQLVRSLYITVKCDNRPIL